MKYKKDYTWLFQRIGGVDQVVLESNESLTHLASLDPKLWVALSCPTKGLDIDARTLELIDADNDGRIRVTDVKKAVTWICDKLVDPSSIFSSPQELPIDAIATTTENGKRLKATASAILSLLDKGDATSLTQEDIIPAAAKVAASDFNGDGILPPLDSLDPDVRQYITDALLCMGGNKDASGKAGIDKDISQAFIGSLKDWDAWSQEVSGATKPLGENTPEAWDLLQQLKGKIDDYFLRCELVAFSPSSEEILNPNKETTSDLEKMLLSADTLTALPLSYIQASAPLTIQSGINPAWKDSLERFFQLINPFLKEQDTLDKGAWKEVQSMFTLYATALSKKPIPREVKVSIPPESTIEKLGSKRIKEILENNLAEKFMNLAEEDARVPAAATDIADVERLVLYHRHLHRLLKNFVNFNDFYSLTEPAVFQAGNLYIDGRNCQLCVYVDDIAKHSDMANMSSMFLLYCECKKINEDDPERPEEKINIVAAVTAGDAELLITGRNGVFIDNKGANWDATVMRVINNSINLRQAIWDPYRRFARLIEEQVNKFAGSKQDELLTRAEKKVSNTLASTPATAEPKFDISKNVGLFAAVGIALGAIGTAIGSIASALFSLTWWQLPLVILAIFLVISGPSVILAWLNLRKRSLGSILEASGWAVNNKLPISIPLANELTNTATLPENASRSYTDPFKKRSTWPAWTLFLFIVVGFVFGWLWYTNNLPSMLQNELPKTPYSVKVKPSTSANKSIKAVISSNATSGSSSAETKVSNESKASNEPKPTNGTTPSS